MLGVDLDAIVAGLASAAAGARALRAHRPADGDGGGIVAIVDYAHTPDGLEQVIVAARGVTAGRVIVVFGAGGDRDHAKRPQMGGDRRRAGRPGRRDI